MKNILRKTLRLLLFWLTLPFSFPTFLLAWFIYWLGNDYISVDDLKEGILHFWFGKD